MHLVIKRTKNVNVKNEHGMTPLHNACLRNGEAAILYLLSNGATVNELNNQNETPIHIACSSGKLRVVQLLLDYGADLKLKGPDGTPEDTAHLAGHEAIVQFLKSIRHKKRTRQKMKKMGQSNTDLTTKRLISQRHILTRSNSQPPVPTMKTEDSMKADVLPKSYRLSDVITRHSSKVDNLRKIFEGLISSSDVNEITDGSITDVEDAEEEEEIIEGRERSLTIDVSPSKRSNRVKKHRRNSSEGHRRRPRRLETTEIFGIKLDRSRNNTNTQKPTVRFRKISKKTSKPFTKKLSQLRCKVIADDALSSKKLRHERIKSDIIARAKGWYTQNIQATSTLFIDDNETVTFHYKDNFFDEDGEPVHHFNLLGTCYRHGDQNEHPLIISLVPKDQIILGIIRSERGDFTFQMDNHDVKKQWSHKKMIRLIQESSEMFRSVNLSGSKDPGLIEELLAFEKLEKNQFKKISNHKIGIIYVREDQTTEPEIFGNVHSSEEFESFLHFLGHRIHLHGWNGYDGGLDTKKNRSGKYSIFTKWLDFEIMFHVSTYIPLLAGEEKYVERKKHIGNDMTCIVFLEGDQKFNPLSIASSFLHAFIVVQSLGNDHYKVAVCSKDDVPEFGPAATEIVYKKDEVLRDFLLSKAINAERATINGRWFKQKRKDARKKLIAMMIEKYV